MNSTNVSTYIHMTSLGVRVRPLKEIYVPVENELEEQELLVLREIVERSNGSTDYVAVDREFNDRLIVLAKRLLATDIPPRHKREKPF